MFTYGVRKRESSLIALRENQRGTRFFALGHFSLDSAAHIWTSRSFGQEHAVLECIRLQRRVRDGGFRSARMVALW